MNTDISIIGGGGVDLDESIQEVEEAEIELIIYGQSLILKWERDQFYNEDWSFRETWNRHEVIASKEISHANEQKERVLHEQGEILNEGNTAIKGSEVLGEFEDDKTLHDFVLDVARKYAEEHKDKWKKKKKPPQQGSLGF